MFHIVLVRDTMMDAYVLILVPFLKMSLICLLIPTKPFLSYINYNSQVLNPTSLVISNIYLTNIKKEIYDTTILFTNVWQNIMVFQCVSGQGANKYKDRYYK